MLFLPLEEDSLLFRACLYYGLVVLLLEIVVPLVFKRRVRVELPRVALRAPATPLSSREFRQQRQALQQQIAALQQATPRKATPKKRQVSSTKRRPVASRSPSPCPSPASSVEEVVLMQSPVASRDLDRRSKGLDREERHIEAVEDQEEDEVSPPSSPLPVGLRRPVTSEKPGLEAAQVPRPYNLPAGVLRGQQVQVNHESTAPEHVDDEDVGHDSVPDQHSPHQEEVEHEEKQEQLNQDLDWKLAAARTETRGSQLPSLTSRRPAESYSDHGLGTGYSGTSEAARRLEALIASRRRRRPSALSVSVAPPPVKLGSNPVVIAAVRVSSLAPPKTNSHSSAFPPPKTEMIAENMRAEEKKEENETEDPSPEKISDFKAFCASFAMGGAAAAQRTAEKRKHHDAFENDDEIPQQKVHRVEEKEPHVEALEKDEEQPREKTPRMTENRNHEELLEKPKEPPQEKTPRIVRRITFEDEVEALADTPSKEVLSPSKELLQSSGKRKHQQAFGIMEEDDADVEWRDSLAFRPRQ